MDDAGKARTIGQRVRQIRQGRRKSLEVIAGLTGISAPTLHRIETGKRALDRTSEIEALAQALEIAPSELVRLPVPAPGNGHTDSAIDAVRRALMAATRRQQVGQVASVDELRSRVGSILTAARRCDQSEVGAALPVLIRDMHTSLAAGRDVAELLDLAVLLHIQAVSHWLREVGAPLDLRWLNDVVLADQLAKERDTPATLGLAAYGAMRVMISAGTFDLAREELAAVTVPTSTPELTQLAGMMSLCHALVAAAGSVPSEAVSAVDQAAELAGRTGEGVAFGLGFGPTNVGLWRMEAGLEIGDHELVAALARELNPEAHPYRSRQSAYWRDYGRALARLRRRRSDAVLALRRAEMLHPHRVQRDPLVREVLAELLSRVDRDSPVGRELWAMAYWAGLPGMV